MAQFFLLKCPKCGNDQKYHTQDKLLSGKRKSCVYCGASFDVHRHMVREL